MEKNSLNKIFADIGRAKEETAKGLIEQKAKEEEERRKKIQETIFGAGSKITAEDDLDELERRIDEQLALAQAGVPKEKKSRRKSKTKNTSATSENIKTVETNTETSAKESPKEVVEDAPNSADIPAKEVPDNQIVTEVKDCLSQNDNVHLETSDNADVPDSDANNDLSEETKIFVDPANLADEEKSISADELLSEEPVQEDSITVVKEETVSTDNACVDDNTSIIEEISKEDNVLSDIVPVEEIKEEDAVIKPIVEPVLTAEKLPAKEMDPFSIEIESIIEENLNEFTEEMPDEIGNTGYYIPYPKQEDDKKTWTIQAPKIKVKPKE